MSERFYGSICLSELLEHAKAKHSSFSKAENGKIYASVNVWINDKEDKFGNLLSIQLNPTKEMKDVEKKFYIGNCKKALGNQQIQDNDVSDLDAPLDVPVRQNSAAAPNAANPADDDLPF
jgi:hypothetical protein